MKKVIWLLVAGLLGMIALLSLAFRQITLPLQEARSQAEAMITENNLLSRMDGFELFVEDETVYTVSGTNAEGQAIYLLLVPAQGQAYAYYQTDFISKAQAQDVTAQRNPDLTITKVTLGMVGEEPAYEVVMKDAQGKLAYDVISARTGDIIKQIRTEWREA